MKALYITATEPRSGKSAVAIGIMKLLRNRVDNVGYIKPIGNGVGSTPDDDIEMVRQLFHLKQDPDVMNPLGIHEAHQIMAQGSIDEILSRILTSYNKIENESEIVVIEGTDYTGDLTALELDINAEISKTLDAPVLMIASGANRKVEDIVEQVSAAKESFDDHGSDFAGVIVTKVDLNQHGKITKKLEKELAKNKINFLGAIPRNELLTQPRMGEIARKIEAKVMFGQEYLPNLAKRPRVAAMTISNAIERFEDGMLVITPGDRDDMILAAAMILRVATTYPNIAGIVLTGDIEPSDAIKRLIGGLSGFNIPILQVPYDTYETAVRIDKMPVTLYAGDTRKIDAVYKSVQDYTDREAILHFLEVKRERKTTPLVFLNGIMERARSSRKTIVLPEGDEERTLRAAARIMNEGVADIILLGDEKAILEAATRVNAKIENARVINPVKSDLTEAYAKEYFEIRKHKKLSYDHAYDAVTDPIFFGTMMVQMGDADGLVSGAVHTTRHTITPAFQIIKTRPDISLVSSVFFMCLPDKVLTYADCAVNPNPNAEQLADIAISSAQTAKQFGFEPLVAMLSYSTGTSGVGPKVERVSEATKIVRKKAPDLMVEGPIQYDAAISPETAAKKLPDSKVAGRANVLIFPDLNAGNTAYKAVQRSARTIAVGPVLQGLNKPVNDLSRGCSIDDIVYTIAITAIQAQD